MIGLSVLCLWITLFVETGFCLFLRHQVTTLDDLKTEEGKKMFLLMFQHRCLSHKIVDQPEFFCPDAFLFDGKSQDTIQAIAKQTFEIDDRYALLNWYLSFLMEISDEHSFYNSVSNSFTEQLKNCSINRSTHQMAVMSAPEFNAKVQSSFPNIDYANYFQSAVDFPSDKDTRACIFKCTNVFARHFGLPNFHQSSFKHYRSLGVLRLVYKKFVAAKIDAEKITSAYITEQQHQFKNLVTNIKTINEDQFFGSNKISDLWEKLYWFLFAFSDVNNTDSSCAALPEITACSQLYTVDMFRVFPFSNSLPPLSLNYILFQEKQKFQQIFTIVESAASRYFIQLEISFDTNAPECVNIAIALAAISEKAEIEKFVNTVFKCLVSKTDSFLCRNVHFQASLSKTFPDAFFSGIYINDSYFWEAALQYYAEFNMHCSDFIECCFDLFIEAYMDILGKFFGDNESLKQNVISCFGNSENLKMACNALKLFLEKLIFLKDSLFTINGEKQKNRILGRIIHFISEIKRFDSSQITLYVNQVKNNSERSTSCEFILYINLLTKLADLCVNAKAMSSADSGINFTNVFHEHEEKHLVASSNGRITFERFKEFYNKNFQTNPQITTFFNEIKSSTQYTDFFLSFQVRHHENETDFYILALYEFIFINDTIGPFTDATDFDAQFFQSRLTFFSFHQNDAPDKNILMLLANSDVLGMRSIKISNPYVVGKHLVSRIELIVDLEHLYQSKSDELKQNFDLQNIGSFCEFIEKVDARTWDTNFLRSIANSLQIMLKPCDNIELYMVSFMNALHQICLYRLISLFVDSECFINWVYENFRNFFLKENVQKTFKFDEFYYRITPSYSEFKKDSVSYILERKFSFLQGRLGANLLQDLQYDEIFEAVPQIIVHISRPEFITAFSLDPNTMQFWDKIESIHCSLFVSPCFSLFETLISLDVAFCKPSICDNECLRLCFGLEFENIQKIINQRLQISNSIPEDTLSSQSQAETRFDVVERFFSFFENTAAFLKPIFLQENESFYELSQPINSSRIRLCLDYANFSIFQMSKFAGKALDLSLRNPNFTTHNLFNVSLYNNLGMQCVFLSKGKAFEIYRMIKHRLPGKIEITMENLTFLDASIAFSYFFTFISSAFGCNSADLLTRTPLICAQKLVSVADLFMDDRSTINVLSHFNALVLYKCPNCTSNFKSKFLCNDIVVSNCQQIVEFLFRLSNAHNFTKNEMLVFYLINYENYTTDDKFSIECRCEDVDAEGSLLRSLIALTDKMAATICDFFQVTLQYTVITVKRENIAPTSS